MVRTAAALPRFFTVTLALSGLSAALPLQAQWSSDAASNLVIADRPLGQVQPKLVGTADGGFYVSWFGNGSDGFDVYLQRLDATGTAQWTPNGILVADRNESSTQDYGLDVDADGNALLAYQYEDGNGVAQVGVSKIGADGTPLWTPAIVVVTDDAGGASSPRVVATTDGDAVVAWTASDGSLVAQKLDSDGAPVWAAAGVAQVPASGFFLIADLRASDNGSAIVSWSAQLSFSDRELWAQKLASADGSDVWGTAPVKVFDGTGGAMQFGYFPAFDADGSGGAAFVWYTAGATAGSVHAQHVLADGSFAFAQNGVSLTTDTTRSHTEPAGAYDAASGDIYAVWRITDTATQTHVSVNAQRIDATGARSWGNTGIVLVPVSTTDQTQLTAVAPGDGAVFSWATDDYPNPMPITAARLDASGAYAWPTETVAIKTDAADTARTTAAQSTNGYTAYVFEDNTGGGGGGFILGQNVNPDGSLGVSVDDTVFADGFDG